MPDRKSGSVRFTGTVYRAHNPKWSWDPLSGAGAAKFGGRFNPVGTSTLYTSLSPTTAMMEASPLGRPFQPLTLIAYRVDAFPVFQATDPAALSTLGFGPSDLSDPNWEDALLDGRDPVQHRLVRAALAGGFVGLLVESFARNATAADRNLVLWRWNEVGGANLTIIDDDGRLPLDDASWRRDR